MKKLLFLTLISLSLTACVSFPVDYPEQTGTKCLQMTDEQIDKNEYSCARIQSFRDSTKWHRVRQWQDLGDVPDFD